MPNSAEKETAPTDDKKAAELNSIDKYVGGRIKLRRKTVGMSQEELGRAVGVSFQQIQKYEKGANRVKASSLHEFASVLQVNINYFFPTRDLLEQSGAPGENPGFSDTAEEHNIMEFIQSRDGIELNRAFHKIKDQRQRRCLIELVRSIAEGQTSD